MSISGIQNGAEQIQGEVNLGTYKIMDFGNSSYILEVMTSLGHKRSYNTYDMDIGMILSSLGYVSVHIKNI